MGVDTDSPQLRGMVRIWLMWKVARIIAAAALFVLSGGLTAAKRIADWVGRSTFVEDAEALGPKAAKMFEWLADQPTLTFYVVPLVLAAVGIGLLFLPFPQGSEDTGKTAPKTELIAPKDAANAPDFYSDDPEAEATDKAAYNELVAFCLDRLIPACDAQITMQTALVRLLSGNERVADLAIDGLRNDWRYKTRGFWENYEKLCSGLTDSPGPSIKFEGIIECVHSLEKEFYKNLCDQGIEFARSAGVTLGKDIMGAEWNRWHFHHVQLVESFSDIARDIRFGKLHRLRPNRWGSYPHPI